MNHKLKINNGLLRIRQLGIFSPGEMLTRKQHLCKSEPREGGGGREILIITIFNIVGLLLFHFLICLRRGKGRQRSRVAGPGSVCFCGASSLLRAHLPNLTKRSHTHSSSLTGCMSFSQEKQYHNTAGGGLYGSPEDRRH